MTTFVILFFIIKIVISKNFLFFTSAARFKGVDLAPKEKTCYTRTSPNFNFLVFFEFLIEFLVGFPD